MWQIWLFFNGKICQFLWQNLAKFRISNGNFLRCQTNLPIQKHQAFFLNLLKITTTNSNNHSIDLFTCRHYWKRKSTQTWKEPCHWAPLHFYVFYWLDLKSKVNMYIGTTLQELWNSETRNKLYELLPNLKESLCNVTKLVTHGWCTLKKEDQPLCLARQLPQPLQ